MPKMWKQSRGWQRGIAAPLSGGGRGSPPSMLLFELRAGTGSNHHLLTEDQSSPERSYSSAAPLVPMHRLGPLLQEQGLVFPARCPVTPLCLLLTAPSTAWHGRGAVRHGTALHGTVQQAMVGHSTAWHGEYEEGSDCKAGFPAHARPCATAEPQDMQCPREVAVMVLVTESQNCFSRKRPSKSSSPMTKPALPGCH